MVEVRSAAIYARISRDVSGERLGVERQLADCRDLAEARDWVVAEEYIDNDISAYRGKARPAYKRMLEDILAGQRDAVIVYHMDRLTRRPIELEEFTQIADRAGLAHVVTVNTDLNLGINDGLFAARILAAVAAQESGRKSERLKRKAREIAESGKPNGGNLRPYGYEADRTTVVESEAAIIRQVADRYVAGESLKSITQWLQDSGALSVAGLPWRTSTLRTTLANPRIAGLRAHNGVVVAKALWPAIITEEQRAQIMAAMERRRVSGRRTPRRYLLSGLLRCGHCGHKLYSAARQDTRRYVCSSSPDHGGCGSLTVVAAPLEEWIAEAVLMRLDSPAMEHALAGRAAADDVYAAVQVELRADEAQMEELAELWAAKSISSAEWKAAREPLEARIYNGQRQLTQLAGNHTLDGVVGQGEKLRESWESLNLSRQAAIIAAVMDFATIQPSEAATSKFNPSRIVPTWRL